MKTLPGLSDIQVQRITRWGIPCLLILLTLSARLLPGARTIDDAYITFRYARNIIHGLGFVYNPGEAVQGTTTPLYTLILVLLGIFNGNFPWLALLINAMSDVVTSLILFQFGNHLQSKTVGFMSGLAWAVAPFSVTFAVGGLETSFYVMLLMATTLAFLKARYPLAALLAALSLLTRPDALLLVGLLGILYGFFAFQQKNRRQFFWVSGIFLTPLILWTCFSLWYFGTPLPHSVQAKLVAYRLPPNAAFIRLLQQYCTPFLEQNILGTGPTAVVLGSIIYPTLYIIGGINAVKLDRRILAVVFFPWIYFGVFALVNPLIFRWYLTPPLPFYFFFIFYGIYQVIFLFSQQHQWLTRYRTSIVTFILLLPVLASLKEWRLTPDHGNQTPAPEMAWIKLENLYKEAISVIPPGYQNKTIAAGDVGVIGYYTNMRILDTVGLNSPQALKYFPLDSQYYVINYAIPAAMILDEKPDYAIFLEIYARKTLLENQNFITQYKLIKSYPTDIYGSKSMMVYERIVE